MKDRTKKATKWSLITLTSIILLIAVVIITVLVLWYHKMYEEIPIVECESSFVMPNQPEDITPIDGESYTEEISEPVGEKVITPIYKKEQIDKKILNILLIGRDVNESSGSNGRSDSMIMLSYNKTTGNVVLTSFLRDSLVPIEGHNDWNRLNATYSWGGVGLTINTINNIFELDIQNYISIDYSGFQKIVDRMDGITVILTEAEANHLNKHYSWGLSEGEVTLNGEKALAYARIRKIDSDFGRTERQRKIIVSAIKKIVNLDNWGKTLSMINDGLEYVKTNLSSGNLISLSSDFLSKDNTDIKTGAVPASGTYSFAKYRKMEIIQVDFDKNKTIIFDRIYGKN